MKNVVFRWLHLTDLHCGQEFQPGRLENIEQHLLDDLKPLVKACGGPLDAVIFSGDLAFSGKPEQYENVNKLLGRIWRRLKALGSEPVLFAVPGNHDVVRPEPPQELQKRISSLVKSSAAKRWLSLERGPAYHILPDIHAAFSSYQAWYKDHSFPRPAEYRAGRLPGDFSATVVKDGARIGVLGLNTTAVQIVKGEFERKLMIFEEQFNAACDGNGPEWAARHNACILLTHQPMDWLEPASKKHMLYEIAIPNQFGVHLFGHTHEHEIISYSAGGTKALVQFNGISLFGWEEVFSGASKVDRRHGYSFGRLELTKGKAKVKFWPRIAKEAKNGHLIWGQDINLSYGVDGATAAIDVAMRPITSRTGNSTVADEQAVTEDSDAEELGALFRKSFEYCVSRFKHPDVTSNTCMYFFGLDFNPIAPVLRQPAIVQAIGTELEHLVSVVWGTVHNPSKAPGRPQIADEVVDAVRFLFMLSIANGIERWDEIPWIKWTHDALRSTDTNGLIAYQTALPEQYSILLRASRDGRIDRSWTTRWLKDYIEALMGFAKCYGVTARMISNDLSDRLSERREDGNSTLNHARQPFPSAGVFVTYRAYFPDRPGVYRDLLREVSDAKFDILASASHSVVLGETAEAVILLATTDTPVPSNADIEARISGIKAAKLRSARARPYDALPNDLLIAFEELHRKTFNVQRISEFQGAVSSAIIDFRSVVRELWGSVPASP